MKNRIGTDLHNQKTKNRKASREHRQQQEEEEEKEAEEDVLSLTISAMKEAHR